MIIDAGFPAIAFSFGAPDFAVLEDFLLVVDFRALEDVFLRVDFFAICPTYP